MAFIDDSYTTGLIHTHQAHGGDYAFDEIGKTWGGGRTISTTNKFGAYSLRFQQQVLTTTADLSYYTFGTGAWTIDFWYAPETRWGGRLFQIDDFGSYSIYASTDSSTMSWGIDYGTVYTFGMSGTGGWQHYAFVCDGTYWKFFLDGTQKGSTQNRIGLNRTPTRMTFGDTNGTGVGGLWGYMDEIRISKGIARWSSNFTPPTAEYAPTRPRVIAQGGNGAAVDFTGADSAIIVGASSTPSINGVPMSLAATIGGVNYYMLVNPPQGTYTPSVGYGGCIACKRINKYHGGGTGSGNNYYTSASGWVAGDILVSHSGAGGTGYGVGDDGVTLYAQGSTYEQNYSWKYGLYESGVYHYNVGGSTTDIAAFGWEEPVNLQGGGWFM